MDGIFFWRCKLWCGRLDVNGGFRHLGKVQSQVLSLLAYFCKYYAEAKRYYSFKSFKWFLLSIAIDWGLHCTKACSCLNSVRKNEKGLRFHFVDDSKPTREADVKVVDICIFRMCFNCKILSGVGFSTIYLRTLASCLSCTYLGFFKGIPVLSSNRWDFMELEVNKKLEKYWLTQVVCLRVRIDEEQI
jgi:hypothetical protein